jgi:beta-lactamase class A
MKCFLYNADCHASDTGNEVKRGFYYTDEDSVFINDTQNNRSNYKPPSRNSGNNPGSTFSSSSNASSNSSNSNTNSNSDLKKEIEEYINGHSAGGTWAVYVKNLGKNEVTEINSGNKMISASVIKLFVMATAYKQISDGTISETATLKSNINKMITVSDNTATNNVINAINGKMTAVNNYNQVNGYSSTSLNRYLGGSRTPENMTSAKDVGNLLEKIYKGSIPKASDMTSLLKAQTRRNKIPAGLPSGVTVGNKTGELSDVENDAAIVYAGGDYIIVVLSQGVNNVSTAQATVKQVSTITYNHYK